MLYIEATLLLDQIEVYRQCICTFNSHIKVTDNDIFCVQNHDYPIMFRNITTIRTGSAVNSWSTGINHGQTINKVRAMDKKILKEFSSPADSVSNVIDGEKTRYIVSSDNKQIELFCQYYSEATPEESAININHSSMIIRPDKNSKKAFCIYGSGHLDTSKWESYNNKEFDNEDARYITFSVHNMVTLLIETTTDLPKYMKENYSGKVTCSTYSDGVYKLTVYGDALRGTTQDIYLPKGCKILDIDIVQTSEKEHFRPYYPSSSEESSKMPYIPLIVIVVVLLIIGFALVIYFCAVKPAADNETASTPTDDKSDQ